MIGDAGTAAHASGGAPVREPTAPIGIQAWFHSRVPTMTNLSRRRLVGASASAAGLTSIAGAGA
ncbi:MAG: hypothetical protein AB7E73_17700, partial [Burkholderiales bacterium]